MLVLYKTVDPGEGCLTGSYVIIEGMEKQNINKRPGNPNWRTGETPKGAVTFQPGESGNPNGRPHKDTCVTTLVKEMMGKPANNGKTHAQLIAEALINLAEQPEQRGHLPAICLLLDRLEGKVTETHRIEGQLALLTPQFIEEARARLLEAKDKTKLLMEGKDAIQGQGQTEGSG